MPTSWFVRDAPVVAAELLGKVLIVDRDGLSTSGRIIETEAYTADDPASHSFTGRTPRNDVMFGPAGLLYVYLSYGIHRCANVVTGAVGDGQAVLVRAIEPVLGIEMMRHRRSGRPDRDLANGPGKLCAAMGIELTDARADLCATRSSIRIVDDGIGPPSTPIIGPRIGITRAVDTPWRFRTPTTP